MTPIPRVRSRRLRVAALLVATSLSLPAAAACGGSEPAGGPGAGPKAGETGEAPPVELIEVPEGFVVDLWAGGLQYPRFMAWSPDGVLVVTESIAGNVVALPDADDDGRADGRRTWITGLDGPHGVAFHDGHLWVATTGRVLRYPLGPGGTPGSPEVVVDDLPPRGQHWTRTLVFGPDDRLYVSVGSSCNVCVEEDPRRAAVVRYAADGSEETLFATGLRNSVGLAFHPVTGELWAADNGRDWLGDELPPEEINVLREGSFYGWPYAFGDRIPDPQLGGEAPGEVESSVPPVATMVAHAAPLGIAFYTGGAFPEEYRGDLFVAQHGSWNRSTPVGYRIVRIEMEGPDRATPGEVRPFATGFLQPEGAWGRPVDVVVGPDGALYVSDDRAGAVYRISRSGERSDPEPQRPGS